MHAGNIYAALYTWLSVKKRGGRIVLRIEDLDRERSRREFIDAIQRDFDLLGLHWDEGPYYQSTRDEAYEAAFRTLCDRSLIYPCFCSRKELIASAPHRGEKSVYAGTCRNLSEAARCERAQEKAPAFRLMVPDSAFAFDDGLQGRYTQNLAAECGDFLVKRADGAFAYQLAVVVDDAAQGVNFVSRGIDLLCSTPQQIYLQGLLGLPQPKYAHFPLLVSSHGKRLSKRDHDASLDAMLLRYRTPQAVVGHIAFAAGLQGTDVPATPQELLERFNEESFVEFARDRIETQYLA